MTARKLGREKKYIGGTKGRGGERGKFPFFQNPTETLATQARLRLAGRTGVIFRAFFRRVQASARRARGKSNTREDSPVERWVALRARLRSPEKLKN